MTIGVMTLVGAIGVYEDVKDVEWYDANEPGRLALCHATQR